MTLKNSTNEHKNSSSEQKNSSNQPQKIVPMNIKKVIWTKKIVQRNKKNCSKEQKSSSEQKIGQINEITVQWTKNSSNEQTNLIQMKIIFFKNSNEHEI